MFSGPLPGAPYFLPLPHVGTQAFRSTGRPANKKRSGRVSDPTRQKAGAWSITACVNQPNSPAHNTLYTSGSDPAGRRPRTCRSRRTPVASSSLMQHPHSLSTCQIFSLSSAPFDLQTRALGHPAPSGHRTPSPFAGFYGGTAFDLHRARCRRRAAGSQQELFLSCLSGRGKSCALAGDNAG